MAHLGAQIVAWGSLRLVWGASIAGCVLLKCTDGRSCCAALLLLLLPTAVLPADVLLPTALLPMLCICSLAIDGGGSEARVPALLPYACATAALTRLVRVKFLCSSRK